MTTTLLLRCASLLVVTGAVAAPAQTPADIVKWTAALPKASHALPAIPVAITAHVASGWHIYAPTQAPGGPTAMTFRIPAGQPFNIAGPVKSSPPLKKRDENFQMETESFEGEARLTVPVAATGSPAPVIPIDVRFQVCNASLCLPPTTVHLEARAEKK